MGKKLRFLFLSLIGLFGSRHTSLAQGSQERNEDIFVQVIAHINDHRSDLVYNMLNGSFRVKYTSEVFAGVLETNLYPLGKITTHELMNYNNGLSRYKVTAGSTLLEFRISLDDSDMIAGLRFLPYKEAASSKTVLVPTDNPLQTKQDRRIDTIARRYINQSTTVGMSIGIYKGDNSYFYGYGSTEKGHNHIPGSDAIFEIGSITKTFTATLLAYYVGEHKVALSDPITKYLPDSVAANKELQQITLQMLANHTSGLPRLPSNLELSNTTMINPYKTYNKEQLFAALKDCKLQSVPGEKYTYSNLAAGLLGAILERVSGISYEQMTTNIICKSFNMTSTMQHPDSAEADRQVAVYNDRGTPVVMWDFDALAGAGALRSTTHDMLLYARANMEQDKTNLGKAIALTHNITCATEMNVGLGWHMNKFPDGTTYYWHNGGTGGSSSYIAFIVEKNIAVVLLSNAATTTDDTGIDLLKLLDK